MYIVYIMGTTERQKKIAVENDCRKGQIKDIVGLMLKFEMNWDDKC